MTDKDVIEAAKAIEDPCFKVAEVEGQLPVGHERTRQMLGDLEGRGIFETKRVGSGRVYWFVGR